MLHKPQHFFYAQSKLRLISNEKDTRNLISRRMPLLVSLSPAKSLWNISKIKIHKAKTN